MWVKYDNETDVAKDITPLLYDRQWSHPVTKNEVDLCFTGGEPMMFQDDMVKIMDECDVSEWRNTKNYPRTIQIETNGTRKLEQNFIDFYAHTRFKLNWNVSPKMRSVSGEKDAVKYDTINSYFELSALGCLKFVVNETDECWKELNEHVTHLDPMIPKYIMPVGSSYEQQTNTKVLEQIAKRAIDNGYHVSGRLQSILFSNVVGS
jgi:organic radical activating enzyme